MARTDYPRGGSSIGASSLLITPSWVGRDLSVLRPVIGLHGNNATSLQWAQGAGIGAHPSVWADQGGFAVLAVDMPIDSVTNDAAVARVLAARLDLLATLGLPGSTRVAISGWSMGGAQALQAIGSDPNAHDLWSKAWLWNALTDPDWAYGLAGYVPAYATTFAPNASFVAEFDAAFAGNYAANRGGHQLLRDDLSKWRGKLPIRLCSASDDNVLPGAAAPYFVAQVADPLVTLRTPQPTGGHTPLFNGVPTDESLRWMMAPAGW